MNSKETSFETSLSINERQVSHKSSFYPNKDNSKDAGQHLPMIASIRPQFDASSRSSSNPMSRRLSAAGTQRKTPAKVLNPPSVSPLRKRCQNNVLQPIVSKPLPLKEAVPVLVIHNSSPLAKDADAKIVQYSGSRNTLGNDSREEDEKQVLSSKRILERSKEIIRGLEPPTEIYRRLVQMKREKSGELTPKTGIQQLKTIAKKLDLTMEISNSGTDISMLNEMKKIPLEYYQKARLSRRREKSNDTPNCRSQYGDDSLNIIPSDLKIPSFYEDETGQSISATPFNVSHRNDRDTSIVIENIKPRNRSFLCPISPFDYNKESNAGSKNNLSNRSILQESNEKAAERVPTRPTEGRKSILEDDSSDHKEFDRKKWISRRVSNLGQELLNLKSQTNNDLGLLKNYQRRFIKDMDKINKDNSGIAEDQLNIDREHLEDVMNERKKKTAGVGAQNAMIKVYAKEGMHLKNKQERKVENIRFERHMAKIDKKIEEKFRNKTSSVNLKKRFVSKTSSKDL